MASISKLANGRKKIQFVVPGGGSKRRSINLGKVSLRAAEAVKFKVEHLVSAVATKHALDLETSMWLIEIPDDLADRLAAVGLSQGRERATLKAFIDGYLAKRTDVKPGTLTALKQGRDSLVQFFGEDKPLSAITPGDADEYRLWLAEKYAEATVGRRIKYAKQFFNTATRKGLLRLDPFMDVRGGSQENRDRLHEITREVTDAVIESCPDAQWRLIVALSRYGGLRCPSEHLALRWGDIDWGRNRIHVTSPKTERYANGKSRTIPVFPELRPYLEEAFEQAKSGSEYVITRYRDSNANLRTQFQRIIKRAGVEPWPRLFHNLRATRQTELSKKHPGHVVCDWIGNSEAIAARHYLKTTDDDFDKALNEAVQNPVQTAHDTTGQRASKKSENPVSSEKDGVCRSVYKQTVGPGGFEPPTNRL